MPPPAGSSSRTPAPGLAALGARFFAANDDLARAHLHRVRGGEDGPVRGAEYAGRAKERAVEGGYALVERPADDFLDALSAA